MAGNRLLGRQKVFFNQILIYKSLLNVFLKNRKKIDFSHFFQDFFPQNMAEISADRPEIGQIMLPIPPDTSKLFPNKNVSNNSHSFGRNPKIRVLGPGAQKRLFW